MDLSRPRVSSTQKVGRVRFALPQLPMLVFLGIVLGLDLLGVSALPRPSVARPLKVDLPGNSSAAAPSHVQQGLLQLSVDETTTAARAARTDFTAGAAASAAAV